MSCLSCQYLEKTVTPTTLCYIIGYYCRQMEKPISIEDSIPCHHYQRVKEL